MARTWKHVICLVITFMSRPLVNVGQMLDMFGGGAGQQSQSSSSSLGGLVGGLLGGAIGGSQGRTINTISYNLPTPPVLYGATAPNNDLIGAEKVHMGLVNGPGSFVHYKGELYAATRDNKIYNMARCRPKLIANLLTPGCEQAGTCGQLTSLRRDPTTGDLIALDTFRGLFRIKVDTGTVEQVYDVNTPVNGRAPVHLNDMVVTSDGIIIMTDSSDAHEFGADIYIGMEGRTSGRLISFIPKTGALQELLPNVFAFPNGIELTHDKTALLVAETGRVRIQRVSLQRPTWLQVTTFSYNLPGLPDNIRATDRGTYWVGMSYPRHSRTQNPMDQYSTNTYYRSIGASRMSYQQLNDMFSKWGIAVELNSQGMIIKSIQDPTGRTMAMVSEVNEFGGVLNIGSPDINYMARLVIPQRGFTADSFIAMSRPFCSSLLLVLAAVVFTRGQNNPCAGSGSGPLAIRLEANINVNDANRDLVVSGAEITNDLTNNYDKNGDGCVTLQEWTDVWRRFKFSAEYAAARIKDLGVDVTSACPIKVDAFSAVSIPLTAFVNANIDSLIKLCEGNVTLYKTVCDCWELKHELCVRDPSFQTYASCQKYVSTVIVG